MKPSQSLAPTLVYKVLKLADWNAACVLGQYHGSADDKRDGFIHLSAAHQIKGTLTKHFSGQECLLLIAFDAASLGVELKWEVSRGGELFPHLYAPLPTALALWQRPLQLGPDGTAVLNEDWLRC